MGDCRIHVWISLGTDPTSTTLTLSADTTVGELWTKITVTHDSKKPVSLTELTGKVSVWDCTRHPARNVGSIDQNQTLFTAGWFPSGSLQVLPTSASSSVARTDYEDIQYIPRTAQDSEKAPAVVSATSLPAASLQKPSELLKSVKTRFDHEKDTTAEALRARQENRRLGRQRDRLRTQQLEARIRKLQGKKSKTSEQVQYMLVKSRATGSSKLQPEDRVYLHLVLDDDTEDYRFFSRQTVVSKIFLGETTTANTVPELLIMVNGMYRRLPPTSRLGDLVDRGFLTIKPVPTVVIYHRSESEEPTPTVDEVDDHEETHEAADETVAVDTSRPGRIDTGIVTPSSTNVRQIEPASTTEESSATDQDEMAELEEALRTLEGKSKKKKSSSAEKVRQMKLKSQAKGDTKRVPMPDRFFVEIILARGTELETPRPTFASREDSVERLLSGLPQSTWHVYRKSDTTPPTLRKIADSSDETSRKRTFAALEADSVLYNFDVLVVRLLES